MEGVPTERGGRSPSGRVWRAFLGAQGGQGQDEQAGGKDSHVAPTAASIGPGEARWLDLLDLRLDENLLNAVNLGEGVGGDVDVGIAFVST